MQSTGEVIGIHTDPRVALAKALLGAALSRRARGRAEPSRWSRSPIATRRSLPRLAAALTTAGYRLAATPGTREALEAAGYEARSVAKLGEEPDAARDEVPILELIASGEVRLVVNTPTPRSGAVRDAAEIRHAATAEGILCLTAIETAVAAAEALDPAIAGRLADVRSLDEWVPREAVVAVDARVAGPCVAQTRGRLSGVTTIAWPSDQSVRVVSPTITTASGTWRSRRHAGGQAIGRLGCGHDVAAPGAQHVPADDGRQLDGPDEAGRQERAGRLVERGAEQVPAALERVGDRDQDPLAVDQQVRQVVGDQVAERDRQQAGSGRGDADGPRHRRGGQDHEPEERRRAGPSRRAAGRAEQVEEDLRLRQAVEQDRADAERDEGDVRPGPAGLQEAAAERAPSHAPVLVGQRERRQPTEQAEPDRERLARSSATRRARTGPSSPA